MINLDFVVNVYISLIKCAFSHSVSLVGVVEDFTSAKGTPVASGGVCFLKNSNDRVQHEHLRLFASSKGIIARVFRLPSKPRSNFGLNTSFSKKNPKNRVE